MAKRNRASLLKRQREAEKRERQAKRAAKAELSARGVYRKKAARHRLLQAMVPPIIN